MARYQPTQKDIWARQNRLRDDARKAAVAEQKAVQAELHKIELARAAGYEKAEKDRFATEAAIEKEAAQEEKEILTQPKTKYTGGTRKNTGAIIVWHFAVEPPTDLPMKKRRAGLGPLLALRPGGGRWQTDDAAYTSLKAKHPYIADDFPEYAAAVQKAITETVAAYPILTELRDDNRMKSIFNAAGVTITDTKTITEAGEYAVYDRRITTVHVPTLTDVIVRAGGLELVYAHRLGDSAKAWISKLDTLKNALRPLGIDPGKMTVTESDSGDIVLKLNDRDPLSDPLPQEIHPYDAEHGKSYVGRAADGTDAYITWHDNALVLVAGMPGGGKTASLMPVLAGMAGLVDMTILDGAASGEWDVLRPMCSTYDDSGDIEVLGDVMENVLALCRERMKKITSAGAINFWHLSATQRENLGLQQMIIVVEEAPNYLASGQLGKAAVAAAQRNMISTGKAVKLVRKAGITICLIAQKPTDKEIPTIIRDLAAVRLCFRLDSDVAAATVLGDAAYVEPKPTSIPPGKPGRFVGRLDARGSILGQAVYVPIDQIEEAVAKAPRPSSNAAVDDEEESSDADDGERGYVHIRDQVPPVGATKSGIRTYPSAPASDDDLIADLAAARGHDATPKPAFTDDDLLDALAEAQRRGLIPNPESKTPKQTGFDF